MPVRDLSVLTVDDDIGDATLVRRNLESISEYSVRFIHARNAADCKAALQDLGVNVVIMDHMLGADTGLDVIAQLRRDGEMRPIIAMTGQGDERLVRDLIQQGADDYLPKRDLTPDTLRRSVESVISRFEQRMTEQKNQQLATQLACKNAELEANNRHLAEMYQTAHEFVDNVSHEFRTPLTVIKEFTSILNDGLVGPVTPEQQEYLRTVLERVDDLSTMVDDMLDISKLESGLLGIARRKCELGEIIDRVRNTLERKAAANHVDLNSQSCDKSAVLYCDPEKIGRVIINLVVNAIKFSKEHGKVELWTRTETEAGMVRVGVTDNGPGIEAEKLHEIFDRFRQVEGDIRSSTRGFGLGLSIARELVVLNFGDISVSSRPGHGSTFDFTIPLFDPPRLIERFLACMNRLRMGCGYVSLVSVHVDRDATSAQRMDVERFVQHQIRKSDLVFPTPLNGWVIVCASNQSDVTSLIQRVQSSHAQANRNRPGTKLPPIDLKSLGTWVIANEQEPLQQAFNHQMRTGEVIHG